MARSTIHINDARSKRIFRELGELQNLTSELVLLGHYPTRGIPVAQVAAWHEMGTSRMPARPLIRQAQTQNGEVQELARTEYKSIIDSGRLATTMARRIAQKMAELVLRAIDNSPGWATKLNPKTIRKKGHDHPLIDSELLRKSVYWRVSKNGVTLQEGRASKP